MRVRIGRVIAAAVIAEILGVVILVCLVAMFGPSGGFQEAQPFAEQLGAWVGPVSGFVLCALGGWWVARVVPRRYKLINGFSMGLAGATLDLAIGATLGAGVAAILLFSNIGRVIGGGIGGWVASRQPE